MNALPLPLRPFSSAPGAAPLLALASERIAENPDVLKPTHDGNFRITCPIPDGYVRQMVHRAHSLSARISADGCIFDMDEVGDGVSGGWMGSCIPPGMYRAFLSAWLASSQARQLELFA